MNKSKIVIKDLMNITKLPLEIWLYIIDISNIHFKSWKYDIKNTHSEIKNNLSHHIWGSVYNMITKLHTVKVFTRYDEPYLIFGENTNELLHISNKKMEKVVSNENMYEYIISKVTSSRILFE